MTKITEDMTIADINKNYPQTKKIFLEYGLFCVGCVASSAETLKQGMIGHGFDETILKEITEKLNIEADKPIETFEKNFEITNRAVIKLEEIKNTNNIQEKYLRIKSESIENYDFEFTNIKTDNDIIFFKNDLKIIIDKISFKNLQNIKLDYIKTEKNEGFVFDEIEEI